MSPNHQIDNSAKNVKKTEQVGQSFLFIINKRHQCTSFGRIRLSLLERYLARYYIVEVMVEVLNRYWNSIAIRHCCTKMQSDLIVSINSDFKKCNKFTQKQAIINVSLPIYQTIFTDHKTCMHFGTKITFSFFCLHRYYILYIQLIKNCV
jgi:hypothetical protein